MTWSRKPKAWTPPAGREQEILNRIEARTEEVGDCLLYQSVQMAPKVNVDGRSSHVEQM